MDQEILSTEQSETLQQIQNMQNGLPEGNSTVEAKPEPVPEPETHETGAAASSADLPTNTEGFVEVDGQQFKSDKDAFDYLKGKYSQLEQERLIDEARYEGIQTALQYQGQNPAAAPVEPKVEDDLDTDKFYEDPKGFLKEYGERIKNEVESTLTARQRAQQADAELWASFTKKYPDLADSRDIVELIANKEADMVKTLAKRSREKAMDFVALKARERFQSWVDSQKPRRELSNTRQGPSVGGNPVATTAPKESGQAKNLDFASQLRTLRSK